MNIDFSPDSHLGKTLEYWWSGLSEDRGTRAELRRCNRAAQVVMTSAFQRQFHVWRPLFAGQNSYAERLAQIMGLVAHVRVHQPGKSIAVQMATGRSGSPAISELRFQRLLQRTREELYPALIRVIQLLRGEANIYDLAESTYFWGDDRRKIWAYDYYGNIPTVSKKG